MRVVEHQIVDDRVAGLEGQRGANVLTADVAQPLAVEDIILEAVAALEEPGDPQQHRIVDERHVHCGFGLKMVVVAHPAKRVTFELVGRLGSGEQHRAPGGIAAKQRALRAFEDLDRAEIVERSGAGPADLDFVHVWQHAGARATKRVYALAAQRVIELVAGLTGAHGKPRYRGLKVVLTNNRSLGERFAAYRGDGHGRALERRLAPLRGDDDLVSRGVRSRRAWSRRSVLSFLGEGREYDPCRSHDRCHVARQRHLALSHHTLSRFARVAAQRSPLRGGKPCRIGESAYGYTPVLKSSTGALIRRVVAG